MTKKNHRNPKKFTERFTMTIIIITSSSPFLNKKFWNKSDPNSKKKKIKRYYPVIQRPVQQ